MAPSRNARLPRLRSMRRALALFLVGGGALASVACGAARPFGAPLTILPMNTTVETPESFEAALLARVNADRAAHGLRAVVFDPELLPAARARAAAQTPGKALSHSELAGTGAGTGAGALAFQRLLDEARVRYSVAGENLARPRVAPDADAARTAEAAERALMASATHRQNILDPAFDRAAVGMTRLPDGQIVFAQIFRAA